MADELRDLRAKITVETDAVLDAISRVRGVDRSEIVREVLHKFALEHVAIGSLIDARLKAEGLGAAGEGAKGRVRK
jgi:Ribbon-helix-helix protein, copG family